MELRSRRLPEKRTQPKVITKTRTIVKTRTRTKRDVRVHVVPVYKERVRYVPAKALPPKERVVIKREGAIIAKPEPVADWEKKIDEKDTGLNMKIEEPQERVKRIQADPVKKKVRKNRKFYDSTISKARRHMLFINPGTVKILDAKKALQTNDWLPPWARPFEAQLSVEDGEIPTRGYAPTF